MTVSFGMDPQKDWTGSTLSLSSLFPLLIAELFRRFYDSFIYRAIIVGIAFSWSVFGWGLGVTTVYWNQCCVVLQYFIYPSVASTAFLSHVVPAPKRFLAVYPILLFYLTLSWVIIVQWWGKRFALFWLETYYVGYLIWTYWFKSHSKYEWGFIMSFKKLPNLFQFKLFQFEGYLLITLKYDTSTIWTWTWKCSDWSQSDWSSRWVLAKLASPIFLLLLLELHCPEK